MGTQQLLFWSYLVPCLHTHPHLPLLHTPTPNHVRKLASLPNHVTTFTTPNCESCDMIANADATDLWMQLIIMLAPGKESEQLARDRERRDMLTCKWGWRP